MGFFNKKAFLVLYGLLCGSFLIQAGPQLIPQKQVFQGIRTKYSQKVAVWPQLKQFKSAAVLNGYNQKSKIHIFLVAFDTLKRVWNVLLGLESEGGSHFWKEISFYGLKSQIASMVQKETGGEILVSEQDVKASLSEIWNNNEQVYFIFVPYKSAHVLNKALATTKTAKKQQLIWYSVDGIKDLHQGVSIKLTYGGGKYDAPLYQKTRAILKDVWGIIKKELLKKQQKNGKKVLKKRDLKSLEPYVQQYIKNVFFALNKAPYLAPVGGWNSLKLSGQALFFYHAHKPYYEFSNFYQPAPILVDGIQYQSSEHFFQAQKFMGNSFAQKYIAQAPSPRQAYARAKEMGGGSLQVSDQFKVTIMFQALILKFLQNPELLEVLLQTKQKYIVEDTGSAKIGPHQHDDPFWGNGLSGKGQNYLGRLLMYLRDLIRIFDQS